MQDMRFSQQWRYNLCFLFGGGGVVVLCSVVVRYHCFRRLCCLHPQCWNEDKAAWFSKTLVSSHHTTWHNNPENYELYV